MTRVGGPPPGLVPPSVTQGVPVTAVLSDLPAALRNLTLGTFLSGIVLERNASGITMLQTGTGTFGIKTTVPLPPGSTVTLQVQSAGAQLQAIVLSVTPQGGVPSKPPALAPGHAQLPPNAPPPNILSATSAAPTLGVIERAVTVPSTITATVIGPAGGAAPGSPPAPPQSAAAPPTGTPAAPRASGTTAPPPQIAGAAPAAPETSASAAQTAVYQRQMSMVSGAPGGATPPAAAASPSAPQAPPRPSTPESGGRIQTVVAERPLAPLASGTQVQVRLIPQAPGPATSTVMSPPAGASPSPSNVASAPSQAAVPTAPAPAPVSATGPTIAGTIVARTPSGQTILDTPVGRILAALPHPVEDLPAGSRIQLELVTAERQAGSPRPSILASGPSALAREWPGLKDALKLLQDAATPDMRAALERAVPRPGPHLAQQMLGFLETAAQGGTKAWLGETIMRMIERLGGGEMVGRLDHDLRDMLATQRAGDGDWRMTIIPMLDDHELRQIRFFERRKKREDKDKRREDSSRFVVECDHSELGALQLDGLMHEQRLDVILRSHDPLPAEMERDILTLFGQTCMGLGLNGQLFFQAVPVFPVSPLDEFSGSAVQVSI